MNQFVPPETEVCVTRRDPIEDAVTTAKFLAGQSQSLIDLAAMLDARTRELAETDRKFIDLSERYTLILAVAQGQKPSKPDPFRHLSPTETATEAMHPDVQIVYDLRQRAEQTQVSLANEIEKHQLAITGHERTNSELRTLLSKALTLKNRYWNSLKRIRGRKR